ncbi:thiamine pyrophosphate-dependent enzyme [Pseudonocardia acaciae]|uniref:thiamine pyrophosphate-dependent enzyme n=1 Tax=Pseudonocardia acaciae TaxID=551276 RepID=UPI00048D3E08|nr:thiamine pyrophosphate-dependent enzyme [Pseudonocardia acaciae]
MRMTGGEALARQLVLEGVTDVFGVPGVQLDHALDGLARWADGMRFFVTRHEQAAAYMADGYARATGDVGVCMVVPGPGVLNAGAGLATAYACSSRVLCIAGQVPSWAIGRRLGLLHEVPGQTALLRSLTKWSGMARTPGEVPGVVRAAMRELRSGRPRPVAVEIPPDVLAATGEVELVAPGDEERRPTVPDPQAIERAAAMLRRADQPVIYAGGGVAASGAGAELAELAERLEAPVVMSRGGRGAVSDRHRLALTSVAGRKVMPDADVVLIVGSRFLTNAGQPVPTAESTELIGLNADPAGLRALDTAVLADARLGLRALTTAVGETAPRSRQAEVDAARAWAERQVSAVQPQYSWLRSLRAAIPDDGILVNELTQVGYLASVAYPVYRAGGFIAPGYQGTLGYGFPTALGAKVGAPDRPVVSITGDGGFGWCLAELATARKHGIGVVTVVFNDSAFGNVRRTQRERFDRRVMGSELVNPDFVALAEAFGVRGALARTPAELEGTLKDALTADEPALIEVPVGEMPSPWHLVLD